MKDTKTNIFASDQKQEYNWLFGKAKGLWPLKLKGIKDPPIFGPKRYTNWGFLGYFEV